MATATATKCKGSGARERRLDVSERTDDGHNLYQCPECWFVGFASAGRLDDHEEVVGDEEETW